MKALTIIPKKAGSTKILDLKEPKIERDEVLVKVLEAGICSTDREIYQGLYGETPQNDEYLVMGHESLGVVIATGRDVSSLKEGNLVVRMVRRPCQEGCLNCISNENDMCLTGNYKEIGIKGLHGVMAECYKEKPEFLVKISQEYKDIGVLLEPLSFAEKTVYQAMKIQRRMVWEPKNALVLGAGPIGLLTAMILRESAIETTNIATSQKKIKSEIIERVDGEYLCTEEKTLERLLANKRYDLVVEATGNARMAYEAMKFVNTNGVLCLTSITGDNQIVEFPISRFNLEFVLGNKALVGVVNSNARDYYRGVERFKKLEEKWPGTLKRLITGRVPLEKYKEGFSQNQGIKTIIDFANDFL